MANIRPFQIALLGVFGILAIVAIYLVRVFEPGISSEDRYYGEQVIVWGSISPDVFRDIRNEIIDVDKDFSAVQYVYIDERNFDDDLVNAIAEGRSPDLIVLKSDALVKHRAKIWPIPYSTISRRDFRDTYVEGAEIFTMSDGVYAIPFVTDPLVLYWNRDLLASAGIAQAPTSWEQVVANTVPKLTIRDNQRNIIQSGLAFGEYRNVRNAKYILLTLALQSGSRMVSEGERSYLVELDKPIVVSDRAPLDASLEFFTDFSNSNSPLYSWNRAQPMDENAFVSEDLALYFGKGSEAERLSEKNPNLNFDVAPVPQGASATIKRTAGDFYGLAVLRAANNAQGAFAVAQTLTAPGTAQRFSKELGMAPANRNLIAEGATSPYRQIILESALITRGWLDPEADTSEGIFQQMVEDVVSGRTRVSNAVSDAVRRLSFEY